MATNFSPCKGSYVLNQFPCNVMFGMNGFHVSASGAIQGHHGPLVLVFDSGDFVRLFSCSVILNLFISISYSYFCCHHLVNPPKLTTLDSSKLRKVTDDNFKVDENGRKFSKGVENTVGKGEIARYEQFLLFKQCFQKTCTADT